MTAQPEDGAAEGIAGARDAVARARRRPILGKIPEPDLYVEGICTCCLTTGRTRRDDIAGSVCWKCWHAGSKCRLVLLATEDDLTR